MIKIDFVDFWPNFKKEDNYFFHLLRQRHHVEIDERDPDIVFFSVDYAKKNERDKYKDHRSTKIFYSGENVRPNFDIPGSIEYPHYSIGRCDYAFTFDYSDDPRNYRLPLWALFINWFDVPHCDHRDQSYLIPPASLLNRASLPKDKFCNFVFSNTSGKRVDILNAIASYGKHVDCCGSLCNNTGYKIRGRGDQRYKIDFLKDYKFTIAAENSQFPGYTTEKIIHPLSVGSIPIYWGSRRVDEDFNPQAFVNVSDYESIEGMVEEVRRIDTDKDLYQSYITAPVFHKNEIPACVLPQNVLYYIEENIL